MEPRGPASVDNNGASAGGSTTGRVRRVPFSLLPAWFAGTDLRILANNPSEWTFYNALGMAVVLLALGNGAAAAVAVGYMLGKPVSSLWWFGLSWTLVLACGVERLVLQLPATRRRWLLLVLVPRVALSLLLAVQFGEPLMLKINQSAIDNRISTVQAAQIAAAKRTAAAREAPAIAAANHAIAQIQKQQKRLTRQREVYRFKSACEATTTDCSHTHQLGCRTWCEHFARLAAIDSTRLSRLHAPSRIAALNMQIASDKGAAASEARQRAAKIKADDGVIAREEALGAIEKAHPIVSAETWFLRALFLALDLLPLTAKLLRILTIESPYEAAAAARRRRDRVGSLRSETQSQVDEDLIAEQGRADVEAGRIGIALENEHRIREEEAKFGASASDGFVARSTANGKPSGAYSLTQLVDEMHAHEQERVAVDPRLARAGRLGATLMGAVALATWLISWLANTSVAGTWVASGAFALAVALGAFTKWYASAPRWALRPIFATLLAGLVMPIFVTAMNL